jgi:glutathione S-transferase
VFAHYNRFIADSIETNQAMLKLYHCAESRSMRSLWLLNEMQIPFELIDMPFDLSVLRSADYLAVHPLGRVPCLVDGEFRLFESGAITEYLCERYPQSGMGRLDRDVERYEWLQWIHYGETMAQHVAALLQQRFFIAREDRSPVIAKLEGRRLEKAVQVLETPLKDRDYLLRTGFSAADIGVGVSLHLADRLIELVKFPGVSRYLERLRARTAFRASLPAGATRPISWLPDD